MNTLRQRLALRYGLVVAVCLLLLGGVTYHEFVREPAMFRRLGIQEPPAGELGELAEVLLYAGVPLIFILGWWFVRKSLKPIDDLARGVEGFHAGNLQARLPRSRNGDEVDRLAASFNDMAERLEQAFQQIREFTLHASHELKTPLTVMRAELETALAATDALPLPRRERVLSLLDEVQRLAKIVDGLTLLTKAESGLLPLERQPVRLDQLVRECYADALVLAEPHQLTLSLPTCTELVVLGDRHRLRQVLLNLTDNAVKYNCPGGRLVLTLRRQGDRAEFELSNTGAGIPSAIQSRVFDRFVRGAEARSLAVEGCGLGLAIVKWIVESHGGTIELATDAAKLTTATLRLPLAGGG
jgi:signal transduction histidine kinase